MPRRLFFAAQQRIAFTLSPNYYQKTQHFTTRKNQEEHGYGGGGGGVPQQQTTTHNNEVAVIVPVVKSHLSVVCVNQLTAREGSDLM